MSLARYNKPRKKMLEEPLKDLAPGIRDVLENLKEHKHEKKPYRARTTQ